MALLEKLLLYLLIILGVLLFLKLDRRLSLVNRLVIAVVVIVVSLLLFLFISAIVTLAFIALVVLVVFYILERKFKISTKLRR